MVIRRVRPEEKFEANLVSAFAFHTRAEDPEKYMRQAREDALKDTTEDWAAFSEDGKVMARIINNRFETFLDGQLIPNGGIGAVSTLPEYRNTGAVRAIFERLIPEAYRNGEVISTLYPFNHAFYRKFGYETVRWRNEYEFPPSVLRGYSFSGSAEMWNSGAPVSEYTKLYNRFAAGYNLAVHRTDASMLKDHLNGEWLKNRKFGYLLRKNGMPVAYVIFRDIRHDPAAILSVEDLAWNGRAGMNAILGFLGRFTADYGTIRMFLPSCVELLSFLQSPGAYDVSQTASQAYMIRVMNTRRLLEVIRKPADAAFVLRTEGDKLIPENNGTWRVQGSRVTETEDQPDLAVSIQALGQLCAGSVSLEEALYRPDVTLFGNETTLHGVFVRKPVLVEDHF